VADDQFIGFNPTAPEGERLAPEVRTEIAYIAPAAITTASVTTPKIKDANVTREKIAPDAIDDTLIADNAVKREHLDTDAVGTAEIEDESVTPAKVAAGIMKFVDTDDEPIDVTGKLMTATAYGALGAVDPNTLYYLSD
jgi:hypothetical protein